MFLRRTPQIRLAYRYLLKQVMTTITAKKACRNVPNNSREAIVNTYEPTFKSASFANAHHVEMISKDASPMYNALIDCVYNAERS